MVNFKPKKNIIMFSIDSRSQNLYSTFGGRFPTPNMDRIAQKSIVFKKMYSNSASTVMTLSAIINNRLPYQFDRFTYPEDKPQFYADNIFKKMKDTGRKNFILFTEKYIQDYADGIYMGDDAERVIIEQGTTKKTIQNILDTIKDVDDPYFLFYHSCSAVPPVTPENPDDPQMLKRIIREDDQALGILYDQINLDDTTLIFYSDHGDMSKEHNNLIGHAFFLYETIIRVPCFITADKPRIINENHHLMQLNPLITDNVIEVAEEIISDTMYKMQPHRVTSILKDQWKYIAHYSPHTAITGSQEELYDLLSDPGENRNLLNDFARHPLRYDWTLEDIKVFDEPSYKSEYLENKTKMFRKRMCDIWVTNLTEIIQKLNPEKIKSVEKISNLSYYEQLALVSRFICDIHKDTSAWYGGKLPPPGENVHPPYNYPGLPKDFKDKVNI